MMRTSLRARVVAIAIALVAIALVVTQTVLLGVLGRYLTDQTDHQIEQGARMLSFRPIEPEESPGGEVQGGPANPGTENPNSANPGIENGDRRPRNNGALPSRIIAIFLAPDGTVSHRSSTPGMEQEPGPRLPHLDTASVADRDGEPFTTDAAQGGGRWRVVVVPLANGQGSVVAAQSLDDVDAAVGRMRTVCLTLGAVCLAVLACAAWFAVRAGLRPLRRIEQTAAAIAEGDLSHRVPEAAPRTEIGRLSASLNGMLAQLETAFEARARSEARMRRFVADAGHELRTPLSSVRGFAELYRLGALREPRDVSRTLRRIEDEAARMSELVEDLLQLARLDEHRPLRSEPVDLRILAADAVHDIQALAPERTVTLTGPDGGPAPATTVDGDESRLRQVVANLVSNALRHTPDGTAVHLVVGTLAAGSHSGGGPGRAAEANGHDPAGTVVIAHDTALLEVRDHGPGLAEGDAHRVFERFYRVDSSRSRAQGGGSGLGLAIVAALTEAHGGRVEVESTLGKGAAFRVLLPAATTPCPRGSGRATG